jgi:hypothetical protein
MVDIVSLAQEIPDSMSVNANANNAKQVPAQPKHELRKKMDVKEKIMGRRILRKSMSVFLCRNS